VLVSESNYTSTIEALDRHPDLVWDLETTGLNPFLGDRIIGVVLGAWEDCSDLNYYFPFRHVSGNLPMSLLVEVLHLVASRGSLTGHNSSRFDAQFAGHENELCLKRLVLSNDVEHIDTMIMAMMDDENRPSYKLENLAKEFDPNAGGAEAELLQRLAKLGHRDKDAKAHMAELPAHLVSPYACNDVSLTRRLRRYLEPKLSFQGLDPLVPEMNKYSRLLTRIQRTGVHMDRVGLARQRVHTATLAETLLAQIQKSAGFGINPQSPKQLQAWLGMPSTAKAALKASGDPRAEMLINYRRAKKAISTYIDPITTRLDWREVIHPQLNMTRDPRDQGGTRSSRLSCSNPNFQALPDPKRDPLNIYGIRACVTPRPGRVLIGADYDRMEVVMAGAYSGDPYVTAAYYEGRDLYDEMAADLGIDRTAAKIAFLALQYGIGPYKLGQQLGISETDAYYVRERWRERHPQIHQAMQSDMQNAEATGLLRLWSGRLMHFDDDKTRYYAAWNRRIQGSCAEVLRYAMQNLEPMLDQYQAEMILQIHDEVWVEAPEEHAQTVAKIMKAVMEGFTEWKLSPRATPTIGRTGAELKG
jgi:DNA polymerase-1